MALKNILITGSNGCVGQYLIDWFLKHTNFSLFLMVRDKNKLSKEIQNNKKVKLLICDLRECRKFSKEISKVDYLIHTATAWGDPKRAYDVNIKAFEDLLSFTDEKKLEKLIYFSTASILNEETELMREALTYGTEYIQTKYRCYQQLRESSFAKKTCVIFPTLVFGGTLDSKGNYPTSYLTEGLKEANKWLWLARFFKVNSRFHFIHAKDIAQICGYLITDSSNKKNFGFRKFVLGQKDLTIDDAIRVLLKRNGLKRYFSITLTKPILKILLKILPIQTNSWDSFSIKKYNFNHKPITNPETFGLKSYGRDLNQIIKLAKLPRCKIN